MTTNEADIDFSYPRLTILLNDDKNWSQLVQYSGKIKD